MATAAAAEQKSGIRSVLRVRDLRVLFSALLISQTGSWAYSVALVTFVFTRTHSVTDVGVASLARFLPQLLLSVYGGVIAERFERVRLLISSDLAACAAQVGLVLVAATGGPIWLAIALAALSAVVQVPYSPATAALVPQLAGERELAAANALDGLIQNLVVAVGPAMGAVLLLLGPAQYAFAVNAASFLASAALLARLHVRSRTTDVTEEGAAGPLAQMKVGFVAVAHSGKARLLLAFCALVTFVYGTDSVVLVPVAHFQLHAGARGFGYLLAGLGTGGVLMAPAISRLAAAPRLATIIMLGAIGYSLPTALLTVVHSPVLGFLIEVFRGGSTLVVDALAITALQRAVAPDLVARVFGVFFSMVLLAVTLGSIVAPVLLRLTDLHTTLYLVAFGPAVFALTGYPALLRLDRESAARVAQLAPRIALLEQLGILESASRTVLERLASTLSEIAVGAGAAVVREGDTADAIYVIVDGAMRVTAHGAAQGGERFLRDLGPGDYFGEIGVLEGIPRTATVTATAPSDLYRLDAQDFLEALTAVPPASTLLDVARTRLATTHPTMQARFSAVPQTERVP
jgi:CRP-like cAMP-binding protein